MAIHRKGWARWPWTIVVGLVVATAHLPTVPADEAEGKARPNVKNKARKEFLQARKAERRKARLAATTVPLPERPARTIETPTIDAAGIDTLIGKSLTDAKTAPARLTGDEEFVRRVYLDVIGKPPTPEQVVAFVRDRSKDKRAKLIDRLLESPDTARNSARYWRDVIKFHATNENPNQVRYPMLEDWLADQFAKNTPWDKIATDLITANGRNDENGATVFTIAQMGQPVELAGEVSRVFLGVQIQCAQCHDHPTDPWKREQFHELAAFFAGIRARRAGMPGKAQGIPAFEVVDQPRPARYTMPDLKDPQKQIPVAPKFFLATDGRPVPEGLTTEQRRALIASYITGQDNPWFAKAFVNRVWTALIGEGFYSPVDDLGPARTSQAPEVLDTLAVQWQRGGYDIRWLYRTILNTKTYQREFRPVGTSAGKTPFAANCPSRLRSDQILDALAQVLGVKLDAPPGPGRPQAKEKGKAAFKDETAKAQKVAEVLAAFRRNNPRNQFNNLFGVDPSTPSDEVFGTIPQALFLMNSPQVNRAIQARPGTMLGEILLATPDNRMALERLYLKVLARRPTAQEVQVCGRYLMTVGDRKAGFEDILWSLINSTEFVSRR